MLHTYSVLVNVSKQTIRGHNSCTIHSFIQNYETVNLTNVNCIIYKMSKQTVVGQCTL